MASEPTEGESRAAAEQAEARDGGAWGFSGWLRDDKVLNCPRCQAQFTVYFRRHHCKQCGGLVCDTCSKHRVRLPRNPQAGKARVCDSCASAIGEDHATTVEEDLAVNTEIIKQIQRALKKMHEECDAHKVVLLELDAEATGDRSPLEEYFKDPEGDTHSFPRLRDRVEKRWVTLLMDLEQQGGQQAELAERCRQARARSDEAARQAQELLTKRNDLDIQLGTMDRARAERDELVRQEAELEQAVAAARRQVQDLELERRERQEQQAQRRARFQFGRLGSGHSSASEPASGPAAFTISTGRQDPLLAGNAGEGRLDGCRRQMAACDIM